MYFKPRTHTHSVSLRSAVAQRSAYPLFVYDSLDRGLDGVKLALPKQVNIPRYNMNGLNCDTLVQARGPVARFAL